METLKTLMLCLCLPAAVMAVLVVGHGIFTVLMRTISPLEAWANWLETTGIELCFDLHGAEPNNAE